MENKLPKNWVETELKNLANLQSGGTPKRGNKDYWNGNIPWVKISDLKKWYVNESEEFISEEGLKNSSAKIFPKGTILFTIFATIGKVAVLNINATTNQAIAGITPIAQINDKYLTYSLIKLSKELEKIGKGVAQKNINLTILRNFKIPLPPKSEQERIVAKLDHLFTELDTLNQKLNQIPNLLKNCRQAILNQAVTGKLTKEWRKGKELEEWEEKKIEEIAEFNPKYSIEDDKNVSFVPMANMGKGVFENLTLDTRKYSEVKKGYRRFKNDDVLLAKITPCFENQKSAVASQLTNNFGCGSSEYYVFKCSDVIFPIFLLFYFKTNSFIQQGTMNMTGSVGHKRVSQDFIKGYLINIPPKEEQTEIVHRVEQLFTELDRIEAKYKTLKQQTDNLPQAILHKAFKGELVPQLATDGNAEDLLVQLKEEKQKIKEKKR